MIMILNHCCVIHVLHVVVLVWSELFNIKSALAIYHWLVLAVFSETKESFTAYQATKRTIWKKKLCYGIGTGSIAHNNHHDHDDVVARNCMCKSCSRKHWRRIESCGRFAYLHAFEIYIVSSTEVIINYFLYRYGFAARQLPWLL